MSTQANETVTAPPAAKEAVDAWFTLGEYVVALERGGCSPAFYGHLVMQARKAVAELNEHIFQVELHRHENR